VKASDEHLVRRPYLLVESMKGGDMSYPQTVKEVLDDSMKFRPKNIEAVLRFKASHPWRGSIEERELKFLRLHQDLCHIYGKRTLLGFGQLDGGTSSDSSYCPADDTVTLRGRLSVVTMLHEWGHVLGKDEHGACRWSINLFKRCFPKQFVKCAHDGHMLRRRHGCT
jgi:hypothetical protein